MAAPVLAQEQFLVDLAQWLARVQQYSSHHPACEKLGDKALASLARAFAEDPVFAVGILRDNVMLGEVAASHPAVKTRLAPYLHERGVLVLRFTHGVTIDELTKFIDLLTTPVQTVFDRGGMAGMARDRGISRVHIEELAHDITTEEREAQRRRGELRTYFSDELRRLLAQRGEAGIGRRLLELLDHPDAAITILEEDPVGLAEAVAGLCLMVQQEEARTGKPLYPKLKAVILGLSPASHDRLLLGFPPLVADFRMALGWAFDGLAEEELARLSLPAFRRHAAELDVVLYALAAAVTHDGRRFSMLRRLGLLLYDLPQDDPAARELLDVLVAPVDDYDSYRRERLVLSTDAERALGPYAPFTPEAPAEESHLAVPPFDARRSLAELVKMASRTRRFEQLCAKLPSISAALSSGGAIDAVAGIVRGLREVNRPDDLAAQALQGVVSPELTARLLAELDGASAGIEGAELDDLVATVKLLVVLNPAAVLDRLEASDSRKMRRILIDAIATGGTLALPFVRGKLGSSAWFVVRNAVMLIPRVGGAPRDLAVVVGHPNEKVRLEVIRSLRGMPADETTMDIVARYMADASAEVRKLAFPMLRGELLAPFAVGLLEEMAADEKQPEDARRRVVEALGRSPQDAAASALFRLIQPRGLMDLGSIRDHAAVALRASKAPRATAYFDEGLKSSVWRVRKACERAAAGGG